MPVVDCGVTAAKFLLDMILFSCMGSKQIKEFVNTLEGNIREQGEWTN
jgi:hypothetical protein